MKRAELEIGGEYYYAKGNDWASPRYGSGSGEKAVVVDLGPYRINRGWGWRERYSEDPKGNAVLVELRRAWDETTVREAVLVAHLRGPYEKLAAEVAEEVRKRDERRAAEDRAVEVARKERDDALARAQSLGVRASWNPDGILLKPGEFQRLLDAYEKTLEG